MMFLGVWAVILVSVGNVAMLKLVINKRSKCRKIRKNKVLNSISNKINNDLLFIKDYIIYNILI